MGPIKSLFFFSVGLFVCLSVCLSVCLFARQSGSAFFLGTLVFSWGMAQYDFDQLDCRILESSIQYLKNDLMYALDYFYVSKHRSDKLIHKYQLGRACYDLVIPKYFILINQQYLNNALKYETDFFVHDLISYGFHRSNKLVAMHMPSGHGLVRLT